MSFAGRQPASLERSLNRTLGTLVLVSLVVITLAGTWIGRQAMEQFVASRLAHDAEALMAALNPETGQLSRSLPPVYNQPLSGHYFIIRGTGSGPVRSRSLWDADLETFDAAPGESKAAFADGPQGQTLFVWHAGYELHGRQISVTMAEDIAPLLLALKRFLIAALVAALAAAARMYWLQKRILRRGFEQIDAVREDVRRLSLGESGELGSDVPEEVKPLVAEFNTLITAWRGHLQRSRNAMGNLAHALKSPLQVLLQHGNDRQDETITVQSERMRQIIDRELRQARLAGNAHAGQRFVPTTDIPDLVELLSSLYRDKALVVDTEIDAPGTVSLDQEDMLELLGNLLDNAAKWATRRILVTATMGEKSFSITVEDDGPGTDPSVTHELPARGARFDETTPGYGLGLSIVCDIVGLYGGQVTFGGSDRLGGFCARAQLPIRSTPARPDSAKR